MAPAEALYDIGCTARLQSVRPQSDGGFRVATVGGDRFRLLDVVVGDDPPYLQAEVEWLAEEEAAEEAAGDAEGMIVPGTGPPGPAAGRPLAAGPRPRRAGHLGRPGLLDVLARASATCSPGTWPRWRASRGRRRPGRGHGRGRRDAPP